MHDAQAGRKLGKLGGTAGGRRVAVFLVKLVHSLIFLSVAVSIGLIFYAGVISRPPRAQKRKLTRTTQIAIGLALGESLIFALNRWTCPLRTLAESLGAESGQVTDIFLPKWFADRIPWIFTPPLLMGLVGLVWPRRA